MNDSQPRPLYRDLAHDSPALHRDLKNMLPQALARIVQAYALAAPLYDPTREMLDRPAGASFNALPARVAQLLLKEVGVEECEALCAAFFACLDGAALPELQRRHPDFADAISLAREVSRFPAPLSERAESIAGVMLLDELRHMHMRKGDHAALLERFEHISQELIPAILHEQNDRLQELLLAAAERLQRNFFQHVQ